MSEVIDTGAVDASSMSNVDGAVPAMEGVTAEELFELIEGKNPDGTPIKKQYKKDELLRIAQKGLGADKAFEDARTTKEQMKQLARAMSDPAQLPAVLAKLGLDFDTLIQERMATMMLENMKSPEEKEMEQLRREAEEYRQLKAQQLKEKEEAEASATGERMQKELFGLIEQTLNTSGVPKTKQTIAEIARYIQIQFNSAQRRGESFHLSQIKPEALVAHMRKMHEDSFTNLFSELDEDGILAMLPDPLQKKIAAALTKKLSAGKVTDINSIKREATPRVEKPKGTKYMTAKELAKAMDADLEEQQKAWERQYGKR